MDKMTSMVTLEQIDTGIKESGTSNYYKPIVSPDSPMDSIHTSGIRRESNKSILSSTSTPGQSVLNKTREHEEYLTSKDGPDITDDIIPHTMSPEAIRELTERLNRQGLSSVTVYIFPFELK